MDEQELSFEVGNLSLTENNDANNDKNVRLRAKTGRRNFSLKEKIDIASQYKPNKIGFGYTALSKKYNVSRTSVQRWVKQIEALKDCLNDQNMQIRQRRRIPGGGRKAVYAELEADLLDFFKQQTLRGMRVTETELSKYFKYL